MNEQASRIQKLPDEILESQKARTDLLRWKLIICAALGAAGLGITGKNSTSTITLLALIPLGCAYVDLLCTNINLRIILIGRYLSTKNDPYESFVAPHRIVFALEDWALYGSTIVISILLILFSLMRFFTHIFYKEYSLSKLCILESIAIIISSIITIILSKWIIKAYDILLNHETLHEGEDAKELFLEKLCERDSFFRYFNRFLSKGKNRDKNP